MVLVSKRIYMLEFFVFFDWIWEMGRFGLLISCWIEGSNRWKMRRRPADFRRPVRRRFSHWIWALFGIFTIVGLVLFVVHHNQSEDRIEQPVLVMPPSVHLLFSTFWASWFGLNRCVHTFVWLNHFSLCCCYINEFNCCCFDLRFLSSIWSNQFPYILIFLLFMHAFIVIPWMFQLIFLA